MKRSIAPSFWLLSAALLLAGPKLSNAQTTTSPGVNNNPQQMDSQEMTPGQGSHPIGDAQPAAVQQPSDTSQPAAGASSNVASDNIAPGAQNEAMQMVPAAAQLQTGLDAKKMQPGAQVQAELTGTVHLKDGTELPRGTRLTGSVTTDNLAQGGKAALAVSFTQAQLKDGTSLPIKATITDIKQARPIDSMTATGSYTLQPWDGRSLIVDEISAISGVDLHSRIAGQSSGVFTTPKKDDVKVASGTQLELAIAKS